MVMNGGTAVLHLLLCCCATASVIHHGGHLRPEISFFFYSF
jgi:hypothetical protein